MNEKVMFIRYDGKKPRIIEDKNKRPLEMYDTPEGFRVYITDDLDAVGALCTINSNKYRLFRSRSFKVKQLTPTSTYQFIDLTSWNYKVATFDTRKLDDNNEKIFDTRIEWYEHGPSEVVEPTESNITGKKPSEEPAVYAELRAAKVQIETLEKEKADLEQKVKDLTEENTILRSAGDEAPKVDEPEKDPPKEEKPEEDSGRVEFSKEKPAQRGRPSKK